MAVHLLCALNRDGFQVTAVSLYDPMGTDLETILESARIPVRYLGKCPGLDLRIYPKLSRILRELRPHVIHTHLSVLRYALALLSYRKAAAKVHTVHNVAEHETDWAGKWVHRLAFHWGVTAVSIAEAVSRSLERIYGLRNVPLIPNGIPVDQYATPTVSPAEWRRANGFAADAVLFASVGRLSHQKNPCLLIKAFAQGPAADSRTQLLVVGEGPLYGRLQEQVNSLGLRGRVRFLGSRSDIPNILAASDVFVLSSDWEGNPLAIMEAMAAGKSVIATRVGGVPELVTHGKTGILVTPGSVSEFASAMQLLLCDPGQRAQLGRAAALHARDHFDVHMMANAYEKLYEALLEKSQTLSRSFR